MENIKIVLNTEHTHAGAKYLAGAVLLVDQGTANWIVEQRIGEVVRPVSKDEKKLDVKPLMNEGE